MTAAILNLTIEQGATFERDLLWQDSAGTPVNLTGYTAKMQIRATADPDSPPLGTWTQGSGITLGGTAGTIKILITDTVTGTLPANRSYVWDLRLKSPANVATRLVKGIVTVDAAVTT